MMRIQLAFLSLLTTSMLFGQPGTSQSCQVDEQGRKQGPWAKTWADSDQLRYQGQFKDDRPIGRFTYYSTSGTVETFLDHYTTGNAAHARHFHPNGKVMAEGRYVGQEKDSIWNYYDDGGILRSVEPYSNGVLHGAVITYYPSGQVAERITYVKGKKDGPASRSFPDGKPKFEAAYRADMPVGTMIWYQPNGKKEVEGSFVMGERDGTWIHYNEDGSIQIMLVYDKGEFVKDKKENGTFKEYYDDEQLRSESTYRNGELHGDHKEYWNNGQWVEKPLNDPASGRTGEMERVLEGQTMKKKATYRAGALHGVVVEFDELGNEISRTEFVQGKPASP